MLPSNFTTTVLPATQFMNVLRKLI